MKKKHTVLKIILAVLLAGMSFLGYKIWKWKSDQSKYMGHGFDYMHGWSTTDFTGYMVYDSDKLVKLGHEPSYMIENEEDMPVLDGAEACYPVYSAMASAVYKNISWIEADAMGKAVDFWQNKSTIKDYDQLDVYLNNGKIVTFTNTVNAYERLINGEVDLVMAARPSANQKQAASELLEQIVTQPIGKEAFVFFVEEDNPIDNLTSERIRAIYHGDITNWGQLGGKHQNIVAFQRPEDSGSQVMMKWFMGNVTLKEPKKIEYIGGMGDIISKVAEYNNEKGAIGYTFKYFLTGLNQEQHVKILKIDGVEPTAENINNGTYPATVDLVCAYLANNDKETVKGMLEFMLSDDGQYIVEQTGYARLPDRNVKPRVENEIEQIEPVEYVSEDGTWTLKRFVKRDDKVLMELKSGNTRMRGYLWYYGEEEDKYPYHFELLNIYKDISFRYDSENDTYLTGPTDGENRGIAPDEGTLFVRK